ncbi:MAG: aminoglycoside phosphotransferase family protein [Ilumatobacteraceae bacterium]
MIQVPDVVRNRALAVGAADWLAELPELVAALEREWEFDVGRQFDEGTEAFVAEVVHTDGTSAVLKLLIPRAEHDDHEAFVLRLADGDGCPMLYRDDPTRNALLMERLGPSMFSLGLPYEQRLPALCDAARRIWRPVPSGDLPTGATKADWLSNYITATWEMLDHPCTAAAVDHAVECARRRLAAHDDERSVLLHGDVHQWNALRADDGFKLVDPDGMFGEAEYDLGVILREDPEELLATGDPFATAQWMANRCGLDAVAIWEWGVVERMSTGLMATQIDLQPAGRQMLAAADLLVGIVTD